jgi:hypothetical protein
MESGADQNDGNADENPFPEPEIDEERSVRNTALARYIQEMERKQEMIAKLNASAK